MYLSKAILRTQKCLKNSGKMLSFTYAASTPSVATHCFTTFKTIFFISSSGDWNSRIRMVITYGKIKWECFFFSNAMPCHQ